MSDSFGIVPLFGYAPTQATLEDVYERCVNDFPESPTRGPIWSGLMMAWKKANEPKVSAQAMVSGDFVILGDEPSHAVFHVRLGTDVPATDEVDRMIEWLNDPQNREITSCDISVIAPVEPDDPGFEAISEAVEFFDDLLATQKGEMSFGYPTLLIPNANDNE